MAQQLRDYQYDVVERTRGQVRRGNRRVLIQGATGAGKNTVAAYLLAAAAAKGKPAVFLAHRRRLITQMQSRLLEFGCGSGAFMAGHPRTPHPVQLVSRDTLFSRAFMNSWSALPPAELLVVDECHNLGDRLEQILAAYPNAVLIGLTATPARGDGRGLGEVYQAMERTAPISRLIEEGHLVRARCFSPGMAVRGKADARTGLVGSPVQWWRRYGGPARPTVLFAANRAESRGACEAFLAAGVAAEHVDAFTPDEERDAVLDRLAEGVTKVVCSVSVLTEGTDVPPVSCVILLRKAGSLVTYLQAVGRGMRPHPGKTDLVVIDHAGAVPRHGYPDEDVDWSLDPSSDVERRNREARKDGKKKTTVVCPECSCVFPGGPACPECGRRMPPPRGRKAKLVQDVLVEAPREKRPEVSRQAAMLRDWARFRAVAAHGGQKARAASAMFRSEHGVWPEHAADGSLPEVPRGCDWDRPAAQVWPQFVAARSSGGDRP